MKKLLLLGAAALLASSSAMAAKWAVVGSYSNPAWDFGASAVLEGTGNELSCTINYLTPGFKIVDIENNNWENQYGTNDNDKYIPVNESYSLKKDGGDLLLPFNVGCVKNATVKFNTNDYTLEIVAEESDIITGYPSDLLVTGGFNGWKLETDEGAVALNKYGWLYTGTVNFTEANSEFKVCASGWTYEVASGSSSNKVQINANAASEVYVGGDNLIAVPSGEQTLVFNAKTMKMAFGEASLTGELPSAEWAIVGSFTDNWNLWSTIPFTFENGTWTATVETLTPGFKIIDLNSRWEDQLGCSTPMEANKEYTLSGKVDGNDPDNITLAGLIQEIKNATLVFDPETPSLTILAEEDNIVVAYPVLYATGDFSNWADPTEEGSILGEEVDGVYTFVVDLGEGGGEFKLATEGWGVEVGGAEDDVVIGYEPMEVKLGGENLVYELEGEQTLVFIYDEMTMYFVDPDAEVTPTPPPTGGDDDDDDDGDEEGDGPTVAISSIDADNAQAVYYNLQGVRVNNPENGVFIVKKGDKTYKVVIR